MLCVGLHERNIGSETVNDHICGMVLTQKRYCFQIAIEHAEKPVRVLRHLHFREFLFSFPLLIDHGYICHLIDAEMLNLVFSVVISYQIVFLVIPAQRPRADTIVSPAMLQFHLLICRPCEILEFNLAFLI